MCMHTCYANTQVDMTSGNAVVAHLTHVLQSKLSLEWREWMTEQLLSQYLADRSFYQLQAEQLVDNPDQRIASDVRWVA